MASGWIVPAELRLLLGDIMRAVLDDDLTTRRRLTTRREVYRLIADTVETWLDQRTQLQLHGTTVTRPLYESRPPQAETSATSRKTQHRNKKAAAAR